MRSPTGEYSILRAFLFSEAKDGDQPRQEDTWQSAWNGAGGFPGRLGLELIWVGELAKAEGVEFLPNRWYRVEIHYDVKYIVVRIDGRERLRVSDSRGRQTGFNHLGFWAAEGLLRSIRHRDDSTGIVASRSGGGKPGSPSE